MERTGKGLKRISDFNYLVELPDNSSSSIYHVNMLKLYHERTETLHNVVSLIDSEMPTYCEKEDVTVKEILKESDF